VIPKSAAKPSSPLRVSGFIPFRQRDNIVSKAHRSYLFADMGAVAVLRGLAFAGGYSVAEPDYRFFDVRPHSQG
jgi:hypothetical protein